MHYELIALWASGQEFCIDMQSVREDSRLDERDSAAGCAGLCPGRHQSARRGVADRGPQTALR